MSEHSTFEGVDELQGANSPATSVSSLFSEQSELQRNSPFLVSQSSPLSTSSVFQRPEFLNTNVPDSETSSRSSWDGLNLRETTSEKIERFRMRTHKRSPSSSGSEEDSNEDTTASRKTSGNSATADEKFVGRGIDAPRGRIANIRRESNCSVDSEVAHERMMKASQQVSTGFDDITIEPERSPSSDFRRRTPSFSTSLGEPISVVTNAFIPHSCSPSPTRLPEAFKQCYSPSTQQIIRPNISYSPSPKHSPSQSPTRHQKAKFVRSVSPILLTNRQSLKRKLTTKDFDLEIKRNFIHRTNTSPLVNDKTFPYPPNPFASYELGAEFASPSVPHSPGQITDSPKSSTLTTCSAGDQEDGCDVPKEDRNDVSLVQQNKNKIEEAIRDIEMKECEMIDECSSTKLKAETISEDVEQMLIESLSAPLPNNGNDDDDF